MSIFVPRENYSRRVNTYDRRVVSLFLVMRKGFEGTNVNARLALFGGQIFRDSR